MKCSSDYHHNIKPRIDNIPEIGDYQWIVVQPISGHPFEFVLQRNDNSSHFIYYFSMETTERYRDCSKFKRLDPRRHDICEKFLRLIGDMGPALVTRLMAVMPVSGAKGNTGYLFLLNIGGRPHYCISKATNSELTSDEV